MPRGAARQAPYDVPAECIYDEAQDLFAIPWHREFGAFFCDPFMGHHQQPFAFNAFVHEGGIFDNLLPAIHDVMRRRLSGGSGWLPPGTGASSASAAPK